MRARAFVHVRAPVCARACACVIASSLLLLLFFSGVIHLNASKLCSADFGTLVFVAKKKKNKNRKKRERERKKKKACRRRDLAGRAKK